jgi:hypothetical protein
MALGQEALLYYGTAGSTASNLIDIVKMTDYTSDAEGVESKYRDSGYVNTQIGTSKAGMKITLRRKTTDAGYAALKTAHLNKTAIALKTTPVSGSAEIIDADFVIVQWHPGPEDMDAVQEVEFDARLNTDLRDPTIS